MKFEPLEVVYYIETGTVHEGLWWNWHRIGSPSIDIITNNMSLKDSEIGTGIKDEDAIYIKRNLLFKTKEDAVVVCNKLKGVHQ